MVSEANAHSMMINREVGRSPYSPVFHLGLCKHLYRITAYNGLDRLISGKVKMHSKNCNDVTLHLFCRALRADLSSSCGKILSAMARVMRPEIEDTKIQILSIEQSYISILISE